MEKAIPKVIKPLLAKFSKIVTNDTSDALPPLKNIQHQIDLSRKTTLLVSISNEVLGFDSIKELYANDEDFGNILMELENKQHRGKFILLDGYSFQGNRLCISHTSLRSQYKEVHAGGLSAYLGRDKTIVPFAIGKHYNELITCDVVDMKAYHVLLGRPWKHDMDVTHQENKTLVIFAASPKEFQAERKETKVSYASVVKGVEDVMEKAIPKVIKPLLAKFSKIVTNDTSDALPPLKNIQHQIDLSRKTTLLVSISNEVLGFDSIKELYANDEDFGNILMELENKQHRGVNIRRYMRED
nr:putative nucleotidyltransferase, ribonuclease H [Tanacetum cinerariifolium]